MIYLRTGIGIEIRHEDLLISCLQSNLSSGVFTYFKRVSNYQHRDREEVRKEIDTFFRSHRLGRDNIVLGLPCRDAIIRHLDLPGEVQDNLKQVVQYQVQSFEPSEEEKFYYDFVPLKTGQNGKRLRVLLVMVKQSLLDARLSLLRELGIRPVAVSITPVALANLFLQSQKDATKKIFILADLRPQGIDVIALREGALVYTRETSRPEGSGWKELLLREIELAAARMRLSAEDAIEKVVLTGDDPAAAQAEMRSSMEDCDLLVGSVRFELAPPVRQHLEQAAGSLGLAHAGLARRAALRLNLLPAHLRLQQTRWAYVPSIILGLTLLVLLASLGLRQTIQEQSLARRLDQEIQSLKPRVDRVQAIRAQARALENRITTIEGILYRRDMNLEALQELTTILPPDTFLNVYMNKEDTISITGNSTSAPDLIPKLERSPLFKNVVQRGTIFKDVQSGKDRFMFEMKLER